MVTMDEYIEPVLAEMQIQEPPQGAIKRILDEPIPEAVKKHLLNPLLSKKYRPSAPPQKRKERKRKAILEIDPNPQKIRSVRKYQKELLGLFKADGLPFKHIEQSLAEKQIPKPLQDVVQNIMDEPIPEAVKKHLLKPLLSLLPLSWRSRRSVFH